jgi:WD40 repeat protein
MSDFEPQRYAPAWTLPLEGSWPMAVAVVGANRVAAGNRDGKIVVWTLPEFDKDAPAPLPTHQLVGHENAITRLVALNDGRHLVSASLDRTIRLWDLHAESDNTAEIVLDSETREREAKKSRNDALLTAPGVTVGNLKPIHMWTDHKDWIQSLNISRDGRWMISGDDSAVTFVWDLQSREKRASWPGYAGNWIVSAALSPDGETAWTAEYCRPRGDFDRPPAQAHFWNAISGESKSDLMTVWFPDVKERDNSYGYGTKWAKVIGRGLIAADFSPDGTLLAAGQGGETDTGQVHLIDVKTGEILRTVSGHRYGVTDVKFSADGKYLLSTGRDTTLRITSVADGKEAAALGEPRGGQFKDWLSALALSSDERWIAASDIAGMIHIWHAK